MTDRFKEYVYKKIKKIRQKNIIESKEKVSEQELNHALKRIADAYKIRNIIVRGLLTGIFTAAGATIGFALFILLLTQIYSSISELPLLSSIMEATGLDKVVEYALEQSGQQDISVNDITSSTGQSTD